MSDSQNAISKCFSGALRGLLCTGSLPTHPSDHIPESAATLKLDSPGKDSKSEPKLAVPANPSIVARLMGLDSLPDINSVPKQRALDSIRRSRSLSFVEYMSALDLTQSLHRRVRTSASFRENPTFPHQHITPDFFSLFTENEKEFNIGLQEMKVNKRDTCKNNGDIREGAPVKKRGEDSENVMKRLAREQGKPKRASAKSSPQNDNVSPRKEKVYRKPPAALKAKSPPKPMKSQKLTEMRKNQHVTKKKRELKRENSNLFDPKNFRVLRDARMQETSGQKVGLDSMLKSSQKITNCDYPSSNPRRCSRTCSDSPEVRSIGGQADKPVKTRTEYYTELLIEICSLTEEDITDSNWVTRKVFKFEDFEEICMEFGQQILEQLVNQVADELVGLHMLKSLTL